VPPKPTPSLLHLPISSPSRLHIAFDLPDPPRVPPLDPIRIVELPVAGWSVHAESRDLENADFATKKSRKIFENSHE
jgi:hypothetical protein